MFEASLSYIVSFRASWDTELDPVSKTEKGQERKRESKLINYKMKKR